MRSIAFTLVLGVAQALLVPPPPGPYSVAVKHFELIDTTREDVFAPQPGTNRRFMASAYLPIDAQYECGTEAVPYMPALTAGAFGVMGESLGVPKGTLEQFEIEFCDISTVKLGGETKTQEFPVAVLSPGYQGTRLLHGAAARSLASLGHIVITVDHTYEALMVEFPDGSTTDHRSGNGTATMLELEARTGDESFIISQLSNTTLTDSLFANFPGTFDSERVAVFGHSFGGATAATTLQRDPRAVGGASFDGPIYGSVGEEGFAKPFLLVSRSYNNTLPRPEWEDFYNSVDAPKMQLAVRNTQHYAFMDVPLLLTQYQVPPSSQPVVDQVFGTLDGREVESAMNDVMVGLLELLFNDDTEPLEQIGDKTDIDVLISDLQGCQ